jgi:hypothetical protein
MLKMTKLDEEINVVMTAIKEFKPREVPSLMKKGFEENPPPPGLLMLIEDIVSSKSTMWFIAGISLEAAGITIQMYSGIVSYPTLDAIIAGLMAIGLYYYQSKKNRAGGV